MSRLLRGTVTATAISAVSATPRQCRFRRHPIKHGACHVGPRNRVSASRGYGRVYKSDLVLSAPADASHQLRSVTRQLSIGCNRLGGSLVDAVLVVLRVPDRHQAAVRVVPEAQYMAEFVSHHAGEIALGQPVDIDDHHSADPTQWIGEGECVAEQGAAPRLVLARQHDPPGQRLVGHRPAVHLGRDVEPDESVQHVIPFVDGAQDLRSIVQVELLVDVDLHDFSFGSDRPAARVVPLALAQAHGFFGRRWIMRHVGQEVARADAGLEQGLEKQQKEKFAAHGTAPSAGQSPGRKAIGDEQMFRGRHNFAR